MSDFNLGDKLFGPVNYPIPEPLKKYVMEIVQGETPTPIKINLSSPPTGFPLLIYVYADYPNLNILGKSSLSSNVPLNLAGQIDISGIQMEVDGAFGQLGLVLHPLTPYYLFHISGQKTTNTWTGFLEALPENFRTHFKSISRTMEPLKIIELLLKGLEHLIPNRNKPISWLDYAITEIFKTSGMVSITNLAEQSEISPRHFRRKFKEIVGISPKYFCKVIQLNAVFKVLKSSDGDDEKLRTIALDHGYFDQAHFINDFNRLIGEFPSKFLNGEFAHLKTYLGRNKV